MRSWVKALSTLFVVASLLFMTLPVAAQLNTAVRGSLGGVVFDATGSVLPDADVTLTGPQGQYKVKTDSMGRYRVQDLVPGSYSVKVEAKGFKTFVSQRDLVSADATSSLDVHLQVGAVTDTITVEAGAVQIGKAARVDPLLDARNALVVDVDVADDVRELVAIRVDTLVLSEKPDAGNAEMMHRLLLCRRDVPLEPRKAALRRQPVADLTAVDAGQHAGQQFGRLVGIDDPARLGEQGRRLEIGCKNLAVAVKDVGPRGRNRVRRDCPADHVGIGRKRIEHEAPGNDGIDERKPGDGKAKPRPRLAGTIAAAAVEQRLHRQTGVTGPAAFPCSTRFLSHRAHLGTSSAGGAGEASSASNASIMAAIASPCGTGRSGK